MEFTCHARRRGKTVSIICTAKATAVTGLGQGGIMIDLPDLATITDEEFVKIVEYWLENTDLVKDDVRRGLVWLLQTECREVLGYNGPGSRRLRLGDGKGAPVRPGTGAFPKLAIRRRP